MSKINLQVGGRYTDRVGRTVVIHSSDTHSTYPFNGDNQSSYTDDGREYAWGEPSTNDLVAVIDQPVKEDPRQTGESDPNGVAANAPGAKLDAGKARPALVLGEFPRALSAVVDIGTYGANKYTPRGWLSVPNGQERYADAAFRHQLKVWAGEKVDDGPGGTGGLHKAQVIWNLLAELELELRAGEKN